MNNKNILSFLHLSRFIAALIIFIFHINIRWPLKLNYYLNNIINSAPVLMSYFFILSGFVLTINYYKKNFSNKEIVFFIKKRFLKTYPLYLVITILYLMLNIKPIGRSLLIYLIEFFLLQAWFPNLFNSFHNDLTWFLSVLFFLYSIFPFLIIFIKKNKKKFKGFYIFLFLYIMSILPYYLTPNCTHKFVFIYTFPLFRLPEFIIGIILGLFFIKENKKKFFYFFISKLTLIVTFIYLIYLSIFGPLIPMYVSHNYMNIPIFSIIILYLSQLNKKMSYTFWGEISYYFYILQGIPINLMLIYYNKIINISYFFKNNYFIFIFLLFFNFFLSLFFYQINEKIKSIKNKFRNY